MKDLEMFCLAIDNSVLNKINLLNYTPVGLGERKYSAKCLRDNTGENISYKNEYYGEYTFHYWLWKNSLINIPDNKWIGFCAYRRFWQKENIKLNNIEKIKDHLLDAAQPVWDEYEVILGDQINLENVKWIKVLKYGKLAFIRNPLSIFKKGRTIRFQFDMFHGNGVLDKAISLLNDNDRDDFRKYVRTKTSYNQGNMFNKKKKKIIKSYYEVIFDWLNKCEDVFGFNLKGYGNMRIYAFLAERFLPFWFNKYCKVLECPVLFYDLKKGDVT